MSAPGSTAALQTENRKLRAEVVRLTGELDQRDKLIKSLEYQIRALLTEQSRPNPNSRPDDGQTTSIPPPATGRTPDKDDNIFSPKPRTIGSLLPPSRRNVEMQQPLAPQQQQQQGQKAAPQNEVTVVAAIEEEESDEEPPKANNANKEGDSNRPMMKAGLKSSRGTIKALPRELSIANGDSDDVTKYSLDDGTPTFEMDKTEMRDAYNARGLYTGTVSKKEQMPHGKGTMEYHLAGRIYQGDWHMGHWHGKGIIRTAEGVYEGEVVNDLKEGQGVYYYMDGRQFEGTFKQDEPVKGTLTFPDKSKYIGELHNGARHGKGIYHFSDGSTYEGESVMDRFEGKGKMTWTDGGWYEGEWSQGEIHGYGMEIRPDGSLRHHGLWRKGVPIRQ